LTGRASNTAEPDSPPSNRIDRTRPVDSDRRDSS
jgi:hypothetical protein